MKIENKQENDIILESFEKVLKVVCELPTPRDSLTVLTRALVAYVNAVAMADERVIADKLLNDVIEFMKGQHAKVIGYGQE